MKTRGGSAVRSSDSPPGRPRDSALNIDRAHGISSELCLCGLLPHKGQPAFRQSV